MKRGKLLWRIVDVLVFASLWAWGGYFWYRRSFFVFYTDPNRLPSDLKIPAAVEVSDPEPERECRTMYKDVPVCDDYARTLFRAACVTSSPTTVVCDISAMDQLYKKNPELFFRYLATSPAWKLREYCDDKRCATRRYRWTDSCWHDQSDGLFVSDHEEASPLEIDTMIYLDGEEIYGRRCLSGGRVDFAAKPTDDETREIMVICQGTNLSMMVSEVGPRGSSRLMQSTFDFIQREFSALVAAGNWGRAKRLLPEGSVRKGAAELKVFADLVGNLSFEAWVNPGEKGKVYLKAFEETKNISLTLNGVGGAPIEYVGWSDDPEEKFYASDDFSFDEYSEENDFAVRLEIWFIPASGGPERKLVERVFKVKGGGR